MTKKTIREVRQIELSKAAFAVLVESGARATTLDRVAARIGMSKSLVLHHFKDKDALFAAVMRRASSGLRDGLVELLHHAESPMDRLASVVLSNFAEPVFNQDVCQAWIILCSATPHSTLSQRIQTVMHARMESNLLCAMRDLDMQRDPGRAARQISHSIDGIWLRAGLQTAPMSSSEGMRDATEAVDWACGFDEQTTKAFRKSVQKMENVAQIVLNSRAFLDKLASVS